MLEQYNLRALVQSYQDGFGDNWKMENFVGSRNDGEDFNFCQRIKNLNNGHGGTKCTFLHSFIQVTQRTNYLFCTP